MYTIIRRTHNNSIVAGGMTSDIDFAAYENDDCELRDCYYLECFDSESEFEAEYYKTKPTGGPSPMSTKPKTLDLTPTWEGIVRGFLPLYSNMSNEGKEELLRQFMRMAEVADLAVKHLDLIREAEEGKGKPTGGAIKMEGITLVFGDKDAWVSKVRRLRKVENRESREITTTHLDALYDVMLNGVVIGHYSVGPEYGGGLLGTYDIMGASGVISFTKYHDDGRLFGYANVDPDTPARYYRNL